MTKRGFVVGSQVLGLEGAVGDATRVAEAMKRRGFEVDLRVGAKATRAEMIDGYQRLIRDSGPQDAALFYFSGHGARAIGPSDAAGERTSFQCIVPVDIEETSDDDFRGIAAQELSDFMRQLTEKTANVTVILDCCHAACMSRGLDARPKVLPRALLAGVASHVERMKAAGLRLDQLDIESNPNAVRFVAAGLQQSAYEYVGAGGIVEGVMTESLLLALAEAEGHEVTWDALAQRVRRRVLSLFPTQRPEIEGPLDRVIFEVKTGADRSGVLAVTVTNESVILHGGRIHGVHHGDEYAIVTMTVAGVEASGQVGVARVVTVEAAESTARVELVAPRTQVPEGARARPLRSAAPSRRIRIEADRSAHEIIAQALATEPRLRVQEVKLGDAGEPAFAMVRVAGEHLALFHGTGASALPPEPFSEQAVNRLVTNLRYLAAAHALRELETRPTESLRERQLEVEWGRVDSDRTLVLAPTGEVVPVGAHVFVRIRNKRPEKPLYVSLFDVGVALKITLLSQSEPSGVLLDEDRPEYVFGARDGAVRGVALSWPQELPADNMREESIVIIATERPRDLRALETRGLTQATRSANGSGGESPLQQLVRQVQHGGMRDLGGEGEADEGFLVRRIEFVLSP